MKESDDAGDGGRLKSGEDRRSETFEDKMAKKIEKNKITPESLDKENPAYTEDEVGDRRKPPRRRDRS